MATMKLEKPINRKKLLPHNRNFVILISIFVPLEAYAEERAMWFELASQMLSDIPSVKCNAQIGLNWFAFLSVVVLRIKASWSRESNPIDELNTMEFLWVDNQLIVN